MRKILSFQPKTVRRLNNLLLKVINAEDYQGLTTAEIGEKVRFIMSDDISKRNRNDV